MTSRTPRWRTRTASTRSATRASSSARRGRRTKPARRSPGRCSPTTPGAAPSSPSRCRTRRPPRAARSRSSPTATSPTTRTPAHDRRHRHLHVPPLRQQPLRPGHAEQRHEHRQPADRGPGLVRPQRLPARRRRNLRRAVRHAGRSGDGVGLRRHDLCLRRRRHLDGPRRRLHHGHERAADRRGRALSTSPRRRSSPAPRGPAHPDRDERGRRHPRELRAASPRSTSTRRARVAASPGPG